MSAAPKLSTEVWREEHENQDTVAVDRAGCAWFYRDGRWHVSGVPIVALRSYVEARETEREQVRAVLVRLQQREGGSWTGDECEDLAEALRLMGAL